NLHLGLRLELEPLLGWPGATVTVSGLNRYGRSLTNEYVGNRYNVQQVFGGQTYMLYALHFEQRLLHDAFSIKAGRYAASDDFNSAGVYGMYMNHGINGFVRNVQVNTQYSVYPFATWGLRLRASVGRLFNARLGIFHNSDRVFDPSRHGADFRIQRGDGFLAVGQLALTPGGSAPNGQSTTAASNQPSGHYWVGATVSRFHYARFDGEGNERLSYGFYAHADQLVYREHAEREEGLVLWTAGGLYPQDVIATIPAQVNAGAIYRGLFPRRPEDALIAGVVYGSFSRSYARAFGSAAGQPVAEPTHELVLELAYRLALRGFFYMEPDIQWISRPAGTGAIDDALVVGMQNGLVF
ncbi:MAG TPA: carbohydrate porin, partial [Polyangiales bacterium]